MPKRIFLTILFVALAITSGYALDNSKVVIPVNRTSPADGKQMFTNYCAPCHGIDGRGHGPVASALKAPATDLTELSNGNNGKFPSAHVFAVLKFGVENASHGSSEMPVWGKVFANMSRVNKSESEQRSNNLVRYLQTIQVK